jgi:hypothetical protein
VARVGSIPIRDALSVLDSFLRKVGQFLCQSMLHADARQSRRSIVSVSATIPRHSTFGDPYASAHPHQVPPLCEGQDVPQTDIVLG